MSASATDRAGGAGRPGRGRVLSVLLAPTVLAALGTLALLAWLGGSGPGGLRPDVFEVTSAVWALLPFALMAGLTIAAVRCWPEGLPAVGIGALVLAVGSAVLYGKMVVDESSTAVLLLLFLPFYQGVLVAVTAVAAVGVHGARRRLSTRSRSR